MYSAKSDPPDSIGLYCTDEELIMSLERMAKGSFFPAGVIADVNPYRYKPSNLPEDVWYFVRSEQKKESEHGFWKAKGDASEIFSNASVTGLRTTLEFFEGWAPYAQRTNWVMQEYRISHKGLHSNSNSKGSSLLCRVFLSSETSGDQKRQPLDQAKIASGSPLHLNSSNVPDTGSSLGLSRFQAGSRVSTGPLQTSEEHQHHHSRDENPFGLDCISRGDYLELDDLADPGSESFSSDDTSCLTLSSDECFDSILLLKDLEDEINKEEKGKSANFKYTVAASTKPDKVVIHPVTSGSVIASHSPDEPVDKGCPVVGVNENTTETPNVSSRIERTSYSRNAETSLNSPVSVLGGENKPPFCRVEKPKRKYLCFMLF